MSAEIVHCDIGVASMLPAGATSPQDASDAVKKVSQLEKLLKAAGQYGEYASKYIALEARTYIDVAKVIGSVSELSGVHSKKRDLIEWLHDMSPSAMEDVFNECVEHGVRISAVFNNYVKTVSDSRKNKRVIEKSRELLGEYLATDKVVVSLDSLYDVEPEIKDAVSNRVRTKLIQHGAVCIGGSTYINPESDIARSELEKAMRIRAKSILADIRALCELPVRAGIETDVLRHEYPWVEAVGGTYPQRVERRIFDVFRQMARREGVFSFHASVDELEGSELMPDYETPYMESLYRSYGEAADKMRQSVQEAVHAQD